MNEKNVNFTELILSLLIYLLLFIINIIKDISKKNIINIMLKN